MTGRVAVLRPDAVSHGARALNLDKTIKEDGNTKRLNLTFHATDDVMVYATWSEGFRPGGINRKGSLPPYKSDFLTNYEFGFKTTWANNRLRFNGAIFQDDWDDFQYSFLGANGLTEIRNAGQARIKGFETDIVWAVTDGFTLSTSLSFLDAKTTDAYCGTVYGGDNLDGSDPYVLPGDPLVRPDGHELLGSAGAARHLRAGAQGAGLPVQPKFKGNAVGRYEFPMGGQRAHIQAGLGVPGRAPGPICAPPSANLFGEQPVVQHRRLRRGHRQRELGPGAVRQERIR